MLAQVGDNPAGREDLLGERRERTQARITGWRTQQTCAEIERHIVAVAPDGDSVLGFEDGDAEVDAIAEEDPSEALRDDPADAVLRQGRDRVLARAAASEILAAHEHVARPHRLGELRSRVTERVRVELVLADHERRVAAGHDLVRIEVVAEEPSSSHQSYFSISRPRPRDTLTAGRFARRRQGQGPRGQGPPDA